MTGKHIERNLFQTLKYIIIGTVSTQMFESFTTFQSKIIVSKYGYLMLLVTFPDKLTPRIDFTDKAVV